METSDQIKASRRAFISYAHEDQTVAEAVRDALEEGGILCWIAPRDAKGGRPYSGQITQAIREAQVLVLVLSSASNRSKHVLREVERAAHCQNHLLTFRIEPVTPADDLVYFLGADHWVDGFRPLPPTQHFPTLLEHVRSLLRSAETALESSDQSDGPASETFGRFHILRHPDGSLFRLGKGGMGVTYKAIDSLLNRPVALKVIAAELLRSPQAKNRFLREAQSAALIQHPHVATIFDFGEEGDAYFYVMEFVEGEDLEHHVGRQGPLLPAAALRVALQIAQALEAAQARKVIHRDIKPANIMAVSNRAGTLDVKLIDFGLAKGAGTDFLDAGRITRTQDFVGSPAFASPEQCETKTLDIRSDIYSLGVTLWYLLTGKRPFSGSVGEVIIAQAVKTPPVEQLVQTPEPVIALLRRMLEKKPEDRFQNPEELQEAIEKAAVQISAEFDAVAQPIVPEPADQLTSAEPVGRDRDQSVRQAQDEDKLPVQATDSPLLDEYLKVEERALVANRYRLVAEEREGNGGRLFRAQDEQAKPGQPSAVALKLLHPGITGDPTLLNLLENEIGVIHQATHPHLVRYDALERTGPCLIREWVHGFLVYDLLRWRRALNATELILLVDRLAATLDFVAGKGLGLVDVSVRKLLVECPPSVREFESLAKGDARGWAECTLKLNPLSLAPLLYRSRNGWDRQTIVPATRVLSVTQAETGIRGAKAVRLYGRLIYELLSGRAPARNGGSSDFRPLPELSQTGNDVLRRACAQDNPTFRSCQEFWDALKMELLERTQRSALAPPMPAAQAPASDRTPLPPPLPIPTSRPVISPEPPRKRFPWLAAGSALAAGALVIGLGTVIVTWPWNRPNPKPSPTPVVVVAPSPSPTVSPVQVTSNKTTPTPAPLPSPVYRKQTRLVVPDQYATIQAAIDAANSGDVVYIKRGTYNETLTFKEGIELAGEDRDTTMVRFASPPTAFYQKGGPPQSPLVVRNCKSGTVRDIAFQETATDSRHLGGPDYAWLAQAIVIEASSINVKNCVATSKAGDGIYAGGSGFENSSKLLLDGNLCVSNRGSGIYLSNGNAATLTHNVCKDNNETGIYCSAEGSVVTENICENNRDSGIRVAAAIHLIQNTCRRNGNDGIYILYLGSIAASIKENLCESNLQAGIHIEMGNPELSANRLQKNHFYGLTYHSGSKPKIQAPQIFEGNSRGEVNPDL
jgi:serine/threonine protein kinase